MERSKEAEGCDQRRRQCSLSKLDEWTHWLLRRFQAGAPVGFGFKDKMAIHEVKAFAKVFADKSTITRTVFKPTDKPALTECSNNGAYVLTT